MIRPFGTVIPTAAALLAQDVIISCRGIEANKKTGPS
jgi:hypothetical protein